MTTVVRSCQTPGCLGIPREDWSVCPTCADRLIADALSRPVQPRKPEWIRRMEDRGLPAKDRTFER